MSTGLNTAGLRAIRSGDPFRASHLHDLAELLDEGQVKAGLGLRMKRIPGMASVLSSDGRRPARFLHPWRVKVEGDRANVREGFVNGRPVFNSEISLSGLEEVEIGEAAIGYVCVQVWVGVETKEIRTFPRAIQLSVTTQNPIVGGTARVFEGSSLFGASSQTLFSEYPLAVLRRAGAGWRVTQYAFFNLQFVYEPGANGSLGRGVFWV